MPVILNIPRISGSQAEMMTVSVPLSPLPTLPIRPPREIFSDVRETFNKV